MQATEVKQLYLRFPADYTQSLKAAAALSGMSLSKFVMQATGPAITRLGIVNPQGDRAENKRVGQ